MTDNAALNANDEIKGFDEEDQLGNTHVDIICSDKVRLTVERQVAMGSEMLKASLDQDHDTKEITDCMNQFFMTRTK